MSRVKSYMVNWTVSNPKRAGIILSDKKYYYMAIDTNTNDITDFGGKVIYSYEDAISGAIREFSEETLFVFPKIRWEDIYHGDALIDDDIVIFIVEVRYDVHEYKTKFLERKNLMLYSEINNIIRISKNRNEAKNQSYQSRFYPLIRNCVNLII